MKKKIFSIWSVLLILIVSIAVLVPGCDGDGACTGRIEVKATLCDAPWTGPVNYTLTGPPAAAPTVINGTNVSATHSVDCGNWTCADVSGGPPGAFLVDITPDPTQEVTSGGTITFTLNFELEQDAWIVEAFDPWTLNGYPIPLEYDAFPCDVLDVHFWQGVMGCPDYQVAVNETSSLMIHLVSYIDNLGGPMQPLGPVQLYVVNDLCAVNKTTEPPTEPPEKVSQMTTPPGGPIDIIVCEPIVVDVETIWTLVKEVEYLKSINWFGISLFEPIPHPCVLFELVVPPSIGMGGIYHFQMQAMAELELMDDEDVDPLNDHATTPVLDLYVIVP